MRVKAGVRGPRPGFPREAGAGTKVTVKICGLTNPADAEAAIEAGADFLGFVFFPASRRCVPLEACGWIRRLDAVPRVGVFRDQSASFIGRIRDEARLDLVQLHGAEPGELCRELGGRERVVKAVHIGRRVDWASVAGIADVARVLFDTASPTGGGTGRAFDWRLLAEAPRELSFWLAGGLRPDNVAAALAAARPDGVDVASGVEASVGRKDAARMRAFVAAVREAASAPGGTPRS